MTLQWLFRAAGILVLAWVALCVALIGFRQQLIYPFVPGIDASRPFGLPGARAVGFQAEDGTDVTVWVTDPVPGRPVLLHFTGNAGALTAAALRLAEFAHRGFGVVLMNYRGAGGAPGQPRQEALVSDAVALYDQLDALMGAEFPPGERVIYGTSLGAAVAVQLAARRRAGAVILGAPFARLCETAQHHYPIVPACLLLWDETWESVDAIGDIGAPVLILHGTEDRVIPVSQARKLYEAAADPKKLIIYPGGRHHDLRLHGSGIDTIAWLEGLFPRL